MRRWCRRLTAPLDVTSRQLEVVRGELGLGLGLGPGLGLGLGLELGLGLGFGLGLGLGGRPEHGHPARQGLRARPEHNHSARQGRGHGLSMATRQGKG